MTGHRGGVGLLRNEEETSKAQPSEKMMIVVKLDQLALFSENRSGRAALRRELQEQLENIHREN
jgi:hypothetical protein